MIGEMFMKTNADQRNIVVPVRMTKAEVEAVQRKAEKEGISRSEWLRGRALSGDDFISNKKLKFRKAIIK